LRGLMHDIRAARARPADIYGWRERHEKRYVRLLSTAIIASMIASTTERSRDNQRGSLPLSLSLSLPASCGFRSVSRIMNQCCRERAGSSPLIFIKETLKKRRSRREFTRASEMLIVLISSLLVQLEFDIIAPHNSRSRKEARWKNTRESHRCIRISHSRPGAHDRSIDHVSPLRRSTSRDMPGGL